MKYWRILLPLFILAIALVFYFFVSFEKRELVSERKIIVAVSADNPPFTFINTEESGNPQGFEIDLIQEIAKKMNVSFEVRDMDFSNIIASLQSGRADLSIACFEKTPERAKNVDFSDPYYESHRSLLSLTPFDSPPLPWTGKKVGVQLGSAHENFLKKKQEAYPSLQIVSYNRIGEMAQDLKNKRVDWILLDTAPAKKLVEQGYYYLFELPVLKSDFCVIALRKNSPFLGEVNAALKALEKDGTLDQLVSKWFKE